ncbi:IS1380 family transposase [Frankia sp. CNm7]|uniref:IS1380 family transposase n=1 Tax=Frankia nepalensis TaxID=1836974 RepID=A0A937RBF4_9ACTN|nr:IS1380 family transposase [Frankia nepalensis]MBL7502515.1 IS1380 family transposase [Frankia nepalensis]MBL7516484.1 IS1380 family transposase [Frankia nepalensis]MBL7519804.1 IS1380 family transposase [Frankia nepalensis]MBL7625834.1 IS1380 family transposase [Frankia nepalensis]
MVQSTGVYPSVRVDAAGRGVVSSAGGVLLTETVRVGGLDRVLSDELARWRSPAATHDPAKVLTDLAVSLALGGDCLADIALLRAEPELFGLVASDPTVSRTIDRLALDVDRALAAIDQARAVARGRVWSLAGRHAPDHAASVEDPLVVDLDATLVTAHSEKEQARPTFKKGYGFHPLWGFIDHGQAGAGEPAAVLLRAGNAGSNTAADHITVATRALGQLPRRLRRSRAVLVRADSAGGTHAFVGWLHRRRVGYSVGFTLPDTTAQLIARLPKEAWTPAYDAEGQPRPGAFVAELTGLMDLAGWPPGMRVLVRKERPHPGAQLRITDVDGNRITAFATNTVRGQLADLELRHRRRARCEDRIRGAKDTGLTNLPLHDFAQNQIWCALVALALDLIAWTQLLALADHPARRWEPKRLRHRLFWLAGRLARHARRTVLHLAAHHPWTPLAVQAITTLRALPAPG